MLDALSIKLLRKHTSIKFGNKTLFNKLLYSRKAICLILNLKNFYIFDKAVSSKQFLKRFMLKKIPIMFVYFLDTFTSRILSITLLHN